MGTPIAGIVGMISIGRRSDAYAADRRVIDVVSGLSAVGVIIDFANDVDPASCQAIVCSNFESYFYIYLSVNADLL